MFLCARLLKKIYDYDVGIVQMGFQLAAFVQHGNVDMISISSLHPQCQLYKSKVLKCKQAVTHHVHSRQDPP